MINNLRDLGGIPTQDGKRIKQGVFARSALLNNVTPEDYDLLYNKIGVRLVVDFRSNDEEIKRPDCVLRDIGYFHIPLMRDNDNSGAPTMAEIRQRVAAAPNDAERIKLLPSMPEFYVSMLTRNFSKTNYSMCIRHMCRYTTGCTLYHCTSGKDRTGMITAGLLLILGVSREEIVKDYMLSKPSSEAEAKELYDKVIRLGGDISLAEAVSSWMVVHEDNINAFLDEAERQCGGLENFAKVLIGLTDEEIEAFKNRALE